MHPFSKYKDTKKLTGELPPHSLFTWPFRLSMTHSGAVINKNGRYFPDLESRVGRYRDSVVPNESLVFFYLNYDNPVSADDYRYALVGCSLVTNIQNSGHFLFDEKELEKLRDGDGMKNFPTLNWALQLTHQGNSTAVRLPYKEYLDHVMLHPEDEPKLEAMRVVIEEPVLVPAFKYVSETIDHDHCLALLYKLRRAARLIEEHGIAPADDALQRIDAHIERIWATRGLYPGLGSVVSLLADLAEGEPDKEGRRGIDVVSAIRAELEPGEDLLEATFRLLESRSPPSAPMRPYGNALRDARAGLRDNTTLVPALKKLSLFSLTTRQIARILFPETEVPHPFGGRKVTLDALVTNPYLLCESYEASTETERERNADLDRESMTDRAIDYFTVDIGMFPDSRYIDRNDTLQNLTIAGPPRLRAFAIEALRKNEDRGHSYASIQTLLDLALQHPLFHKDAIALREDQFLTADARQHFAERIVLKERDGRHFFYLRETRDAEEIVRDFVGNAIAVPDRSIEFTWLESYLRSEADALKTQISGFAEESFIAERRSLMQGALQKSLFCITGRPGSGKTQALRAILDRLESAGETAVVLAPTGKAALRLNEHSSQHRWRAETIDRWIYSNGLAAYIDGGISLKLMQRSDRFKAVDNLIIDEMSMVGLLQLALIFRALEVHQPGTVRRIILVGDENQLPPIACGRSFADIVEFLQADARREESFLVRLATNCRQKYDSTVLDAAHLFAGKNRYHTELWDAILAGGEISEFLTVRYWKSPGELDGMVRDAVENGLAAEVPDRAGRTDEVAFNLALGLYENGYVPDQRKASISLDRFQILTPYRGGGAGALRLSEVMRAKYRHDSWPEKFHRDTSFGHSDKVIRIKNWYAWNSATKSRELRLSNGSIGVLCNNRNGRKGYFAEAEWPVDWERMDEEDFELAYAITVHKAQGSEFNEVIVVVPERRALLSRELVYTALTRSKTRLTLLVERSTRANPLQIARERSDLLTRSSSIFVEPAERNRALEPESGIKVQSKVEYVIYKALQAARERGVLAFDYERERELPLDAKLVKVHPDFTVICGGKTYYWEHLGMLDRRDYANDWRRRLAGYRAAGLADALVTTDDLGGLSDARVSQVIDDLVAGTLRGEEQSRIFSDHHYRL